MRKQTRANRRAATSLGDAFRKAGVQPAAKPRRAITVSVPAGTFINCVVRNPAAYRVNELRREAQRKAEGRVTYRKSNKPTGFRRRSMA